MRGEGRGERGEERRERGEGRGERGEGRGERGEEGERAEGSRRSKEIKTYSCLGKHQI